MIFVDPKNFSLELYSTFFCFCHDPEVPVRHTVASSFYEVSQEMYVMETLFGLIFITILNIESYSDIFIII